MLTSPADQKNSLSINKPHLGSQTNQNRHCQVWKETFSCCFHCWTLGQPISERQCLPHIPSNLTPRAGETNDSVASRSVGVTAEPVGALAVWMWATAGKPITPLAEIMSQWSQVYRDIYRINKTLSLAVSLGCPISWKPFKPLLGCGEGGGGWGRRWEGGTSGKEEQGKPATKMLRAKKKWLGFLL